MTTSWRARVRRVALIAALGTGAQNALGAQHLLLPMDDAQTNHLKAYGVTFAALGEGGSVQMPLMKTFWTSSWGTLTDKFGVPWMVGVQS